MSGTKEGGLKARETNKRRHGEDYYKNIGSRGGKKSRTGGFYGDHERAVREGRKGGLISRRRSAPKQKFLDEFEPLVRKYIDRGASIHELCLRFKVSQVTIRKWAERHDVKL